MKLVMLDDFLVNHDGLPFDIPNQFNQIERYDSTAPEDTLARIGNADAVIVNRVPLTAKIIAQSPNLKLICLFGTGYNMIDIKAASKHGIVVCNVPSYSTFAVAQNTIALLLEITGRISLSSAYVREGRWKRAADPYITFIPLIELWGKTMGIIGYGAIGTQVGEIALALGMQVLAYRRHPDPSCKRNGVQFVDLDTLLTKSDVVSLHCPLNEQTYHLINQDTIAKMKDGAILLNTSRGSVINEQDVAEALENGKLYMAGLDVLSSEPPTPENPLVAHPRCVVTPHLAWSPKETRQRMLDITSQNLYAFVNGRPIHVVNC